MLEHLRTTLKNRTTDGGATAVEYVLLVVAIALIMVVGAFLLGKALNSKFSQVSTCVSGAGPNTSSCQS